MFFLTLCALWVLPARPSAAGGPDSAYVVGRVAVEGHQALSTRQILEELAIRSGDTLSPEEARRRFARLLTRYRGLGYPRVEIQARWEPGAGGERDLHLTIGEGDRLRTRSVSFEGCGGVPCRVLEALMETRPGVLFRTAVFEGDADRLLEAYAERGYPYARIEPRPTWAGGGGIDLALWIDEGPRVILEEVLIHGNASTRDYVIERECRIAPGDAYTQRKIDLIQPRLLRLGYFEEVSASVALRDRTGRGVLDIRVKERKANSLYGAVGYVPREPKGYLTGILDLAFRNIAGTGRSAQVRWRTYQPGAFEWTFAYGEPWVAGIPLEAGISIHQEVRDSTFTRTVGEASLEYPLGETFWARVAGRSEGVVAGSAGKGSIRASRRRLADLGVRFDRRDDSLNPTRGLRMELGVAYGRKRYEGQEGGSVHSTVYRMRGEVFLPLARRQVLALVSTARLLDSSEREIPEHEQFTVGGAESLRGYSEDEFYGWRVATVGVEYRFLLGRRSRMHVFADSAWLVRRLPVEGDLVDREKGLLGYGFGLRSESRLGMVGVDFGLARGEPLTEGKIHLRLEGEF